VTDAFRAKVASLSAACGVIPDKETVAMQIFIRLGERAAEFTRSALLQTQAKSRIPR
jgi:hypothetical protein